MIETAATIDLLNATLPNDTDPLAEGNGHIKLIKSALKASFPNLVGAMTASTAALNAIAGYFLPAGLSLPPQGSVDPLKGATVTLNKGASATSTASVGAYGDSAVLISQNTATSAVGQAFVTSQGVLDITGSAPDVQFNGVSIAPVLVHSGFIFMWSGSASTIPAGYVICDGTHFTPDLRDRFIVGAGGSYTPYQTGGAASVTATSSAVGNHSHTGYTQAGGAHQHAAYADVQGAHSHSGNTGGHSLTLSEMPPHSHSVNLPGAGMSGASGITYVTPGGPDNLVATSTAGSGVAHSHPISTDGGHTHNLSVAFAPDHNHAITGDGSHVHTVTTATLPPFYALCFIMKT